MLHSKHRLLLVYRKRPGAIYKEQKSISDREAEKGEDLAGSDQEREGENSDGEETASLLPNDNRHGHYGTADIQGTPNINYNQ